jgi:transcriptional regulator with XRE-family HTH domain
MSKRTSSIDKHIGMRVRRTRLFRDMSQEAFAAALGLPLLQVKKFESGFERIGAGQLAEICRVLKVRPSFFFAELKVQGSAPATASPADAAAAPSSIQAPDPAARLAELVADDAVRSSPIYDLLRKLEKELRARRRPAPRANGEARTDAT